MCELEIRWLRKNVDLSMLVKRIEAFFHHMGFATALEKVTDGYVIQAVSSKIPGLRLRIQVVGQPDNFTVDSVPGGKRGGFLSPSMIAGYLTSMFGGGYLISREARKRERYDKVERAFWRHVQTQVADLVDSATHVKNQSET